jgi:hypothetical protein
MQQRHRPVPTAVLVLTVAAAALAAGCTGSPAGTAGPPRGPTASAGSTAAGPPPITSGPGGSTPSTPPSIPYRPTPAVDRRPTATDSLAGFFAAARTDDARIRAAARAVNREIGPTFIHVTRATVHTVTASTPDRSARAIPAGLDADLLRATLTVYSDLATRASALNPTLDFIGIDESRPRTDPEVVGFLDGLRRGSLVARGYPADLAAAQALAAARPPVVPARPDSRTAAGLAVRIALVKIANGCNGGNPPVLRYLVPIIWKTTVTPDGRRHDGTYGGIPFTLKLGIDGPEGGRWDVGLDVC